MKINWNQVGGNGRPIQETQKAYLEQTTTDWGTPQLPMLPMGPQPTPFNITNSGNGSR